MLIKQTFKFLERNYLKQVNTLSRVDGSTVGPRLSELRLSEPSIIRTVQLTVLLEYFDFKCMFY